MVSKALWGCVCMASPQGLILCGGTLFKACLAAGHWPCHTSTIIFKDMQIATSPDLNPEKRAVMKILVVLLLQVRNKHCL